VLITEAESITSVRSRCTKKHAQCRNVYEVNVL